jgi:hypothetical protein
MTSFYGRGGGTGTGGSGTSNYNELSNKPITNLVGLTAINLSTLTIGLYNIRGNYIFNAEGGEVKAFSSPTFVKVMLDTVTNDKIVTFDTYENGKHLTYSIDYFNDGTYHIDKFTYEIITTEAGTTEDLPEEGDSTKLYATDEGLFVWNETAQEYVQLGTEEGGNQAWDEME